MTLSLLLTYITVAALALTGITHFALKSTKSLWMSLLQNFAGALFIFSGYVKAVDPLGTAYKMEQYFAEFESTFADTAVGFIAPLFPLLSEFTVGFSVFMIVLEIVLGLMLILGTKPKLTAWLFLSIVAFFTVLTGFTYLTGYVPSGVNFFAFGDWDVYKDTNMKVTDCGCFGDFLKLEPYTSFLKDVFLMVPALAFLFSTDKMHRLFKPTVRAGLVGVTTAATLVMCLSNFMWDIPKQDFRPFKVGTDVATVKQAEMDAAAAVQVTGYEMVSKENGEVVNLTMEQFLADYTNYPEEAWEYVQLKSEPAIEATKISDFELQDNEGYDPVPELLDNKGYTFMIVAYKLKGEAGNWSDSYLEGWNEIMPTLKQAESAGHRVVAMTKFNDDASIEDFQKSIGAQFPFYRGDDIMLKTIIRANPGIVLLRDGVIVNKWHHGKLPAFDQIAASHQIAAANK